MSSDPWQLEIESILEFVRGRRELEEIPTENVVISPTLSIRTRASQIDATEAKQTNVTEVEVLKTAKITGTRKADKTSVQAKDSKQSDKTKDPEEKKCKSRYDREGSMFPTRPDYEKLKELHRFDEQQRLKDPRQQNTPFWASYEATKASQERVADIAAYYGVEAGLADLEAIDTAREVNGDTTQRIIYRRRCRPVAGFSYSERMRSKPTQDGRVEKSGKAKKKKTLAEYKRKRLEKELQEQE